MSLLLAATSGGTTPVSGSDAATGTDAAAIAAALVPADSGAGTDAAASAAALVGADAGRGAAAVSMVAAASGVDANRSPARAGLMGIVLEKRPRLSCGQEIERAP